MAGHEDAQVEGTARGHQRPADLPEAKSRSRHQRQEAHAARRLSQARSTHCARVSVPLAGPSSAPVPQPGEEQSLTFCWPDEAAWRPHPRQGERVTARATSPNLCAHVWVTHTHSKKAH